MLLFDLSSRVGSAISVHSPVFSVDRRARNGHSEQVPCGASDGNSAYERLKRLPHRGLLWPLGTAVLFRVPGKVPRRCHDGEVAPGHVAG